MSRYLAVGGARGGTEGTGSVRRCSGLERGGHGRSGARKVPGMEGAGRRAEAAAPVGTWRTLRDAPRARGERGGACPGLLRAVSGCSEPILQTGISPRASVALPSSFPARSDWRGVQGRMN